LRYPLEAIHFIEYHLKNVWGNFEPVNITAQVFRFPASRW